MKTQSSFFRFHFVLLYFFPLMHVLALILHRGKKVSQNEKREKLAYLGFLIHKIWQILKHFTGTFRQALTLKLGGVSSIHCGHLQIQYRILLRYFFLLNLVRISYFRMKILLHTVSALLQCRRSIKI